MDDAEVIWSVEPNDCQLESCLACEVVDEIEVVVSADQSDRCEALIAALADPDWQVRRAAASALPELGPGPVLDVLFALLASENAGERNAAIKVFVRMGPPALEHLIPGLVFGDPDVRNFCALSLGLIGDHRATPHIVSALDIEPDPNVRYMMIEALGRLNDPSAIPCLMRALQEDAWIKAPAVDALGRMRCTAAVTALVRVLDDAEVGGVAADALGRMGDVRAVLPLARAAGSAPDGAAGFFLSALKEILDSPAQDTALVFARLGSLLADDDRRSLNRAVERGLRDPRSAPMSLVVADWLDEPGLLSATVMAMADVSLHDHGLALVARWLPRVDVSLIPALAGEVSVHGVQVLLEAIAAVGLDGDVCWIEECLEDSNPLIAAAAAKALGACGDLRAGARLVGMLGHPLEEVRAGAAAGLGRLGADSFAPALLALAMEGTEDQRVAVADVLASRSGWSDENLARAVRILAADTHAPVRRALARTLPAAPGYLADMLSARLTMDSEAAVRRATYDALGRVSSPGARVYLRGLLADDDVNVRVSALQCMLVSADQSDFGSYVAATGDTDPRVRIAALNGLASVSRPEALPAIRRGLDDTDPDMYRAALRALAAADLSEAAAVAVGALYSDEWQVRAAAVAVLSTVGGEEAREAIRRALSDEDADVRAAAIAACPRVLGAACIPELLGLVEDERVGTHARDALLQVACDAREVVLGNLRASHGKARSALLRIAASVCDADDALVSELLLSASEEDRFYAALALANGSIDDGWTIRDSTISEEDPSVALVLAGVVAANARSAGAPHA